MATLASVRFKLCSKSADQDEEVALYVGLEGSSMVLCPLCSTWLPAMKSEGQEEKHLPGEGGQ